MISVFCLIGRQPPLLRQPERSPPFIGGKEASWIISSFARTKACLRRITTMKRKD
jgi:hypothetical protein